ncbi:methylesterase 1 [Citrus sinensis]|nr:methylesterase 1 [Citrus sinensis]
MKPYRQQKIERMAEAKKQKHFVLVHGTSHGAWCWYKVKPQLEAAGHRVTALDLAASGINVKKIEEVPTFYEYSEPLLEVLASLPAEEKVILVGHSFGGLSLALAADTFPHKISVAIFLTAFMPDTKHQPSYVVDKLLDGISSEEWLDTQFSVMDTSNPSHVSISFGHNFLTLKLYPLCSPQDVELGKMLVRPGSLFQDDLSKANKFTNEGYGSAKRVYVVCDEDICIPKEFQHWMIQNNPVDQVMEIKGADHMPMLSKPQQLLDCLSQIAHKYT